MFPLFHGPNADFFMFAFWIMTVLGICFIVSVPARLIAKRNKIRDEADAEYRANKLEADNRLAELAQIQKIFETIFSRPGAQMTPEMGEQLRRALGLVAPSLPDMTALTELIERLKVATQQAMEVENPAEYFWTKRFEAACELVKHLEDERGVLPTEVQEILARANEPTKVSQMSIVSRTSLTHGRTRETGSDEPPPSTPTAAVS